MDSKKSINSFEMKKNKLPDYLLNNSFFYKFVNNFSEFLSCKINIYDFFEWPIFSDFFLYREILKL